MSFNYLYIHQVSMNLRPVSSVTVIKTIESCLLDPGSVILTVLTVLIVSYRPSAILLVCVCAIFILFRKTYSQPSEEEVKSKGLTIAVQASDSMTVFVGSNPGLEMH